ncbi:ACP S-malonyltransferase [Azohydromonas caseinilytica]|uniref:Acyltransferase domain-containing protein n=1 Tax=Azohydromonas caseinilytica TaxID=2728836 RepID=A0A848FAX7_9BURK|nr:acyltransferase domain-containing protein [Azohydromonas caseinilytica]NML16482.1 acyltransferase domain-containing protein [Azohydromonas caseinilytica]
MRFALVFAGQGMQHAGMLPWLARGDGVRAVEQQLGEDWRERLADPAWAGRNANAQVLLTGLGLAAWTQLAPLLPPPAMVAGYSVGEMAAFCAAGVYDVPTALSLAQQRAACMDAAAAREATGLLGVTGLAPAGVAALCARFDLEVAIRNGYDSVVLGGRRSALEAALQDAERQGARCTPLNVALASHTRWMREAAEAFERALAPVALSRPRVPLLSNALGRVRDAAQARQALVEQIARTVQWEDCMEALAAQRVDAVLEIGPGQALAKMWQQRCPDIPARSADEFRSAAAVAKWVLAQGD